MKFRHVLLRFGLGCLCCCRIADAASATAAAAEATRTFDIPAGDAAITLKAFSEQSGRSVLFSPDNVAGIATAKLSGTIAVQAALDRLLAGTPLYAVPTREPGGYAIKHEGLHGPNGQGAAQPAMRDRPLRNRETAATSSAGAGTVDQTIELSPFVVNTDKDVGFIAASALAGGRLAGDLKDTPVAYSVLTREFIDALDLTDLVSASEWTVNSVDSRRARAKARCSATVSIFRRAA